MEFWRLGPSLIFMKFWSRNNLDKFDLVDPSEPLLLTYVAQYDSVYIEPKKYGSVNFMTKLVVLLLDMQ